LIIADGFYEWRPINNLNS